MLEIAVEPDVAPDAAEVLASAATAIDAAVAAGDAEGATTELRDAMAAAAAAGATTVVVDAEPATDGHDRLATELGLLCRRELLQLRRSLPLVDVARPARDLATRALRPGRDDDAWLAVNNAAFHWHPDQAGWTRSDLDTRVAEAWFDPEGFLLHEEGGRLAGFCWTKVHADHDPPLGEIYVIAVHPDFQGRGLGRALAVAGLDHLAGRGLPAAMLYVEADNEPALAVYRSLGFAVHHRHRWYEGPTRPPQ